MNLEIGIVVVVDVLQEHIEEARHLYVLGLGKKIAKEEGIEEVADARQRQGNDDKSGNEGGGIGAAMLGLGLPRPPGVGILAAHGTLCRRAGSGALRCVGHRRLIAKAEGGAWVLAEFVQVPEHLRGALVALVQIGGHGVHGDLLQTLGDLGIQDPGRDGLGVDVLDGHRDGRLAVVGRVAGEHLIHDHAQRVEVGAEVDPVALGLLGRDIVHRAQGFPGESGLGRGHPGNAEVGHLDAAVLENHDVVGLDVPVDDPAAVGMLQCLGDLGGKVQRFPPVEDALLLHVLLQGDTVDELHDDIVHIVRMGHVVDIDDIGMREHGDGLGLGMEAAAKLRILRQLVLEDLDGHQPVEPVTPRLIHHGHAAGSDHFQNLVAVIQQPPDIILHK